MRKDHRRSGITLVEIMIVMTIVAFAAVGIGLGFGAIARTNLRAACNRLVAASRFAYNRAITESKTVRIVLDASTQTMALEEAHGKLTLARADDPLRETSEEETGEDHAAVDPWAAAAAKLTDVMRPTLGATGFSPIPGSRYAAAPLGSGIRVVRMTLPHETRSRTEGRGSIYYFPGGITERAVVYLADTTDTIYTVVIHPLTGRARVYNEEFTPREIDDAASDEDRSETGDPG